MEEKKEKGNFWLTVATFIVNKRKAIYVLFFIAIIYSVVSVNKVSVNQDITKYLPADSETNRGLNLMEEQFLTYGSARVMVSNITYTDAQKLVDELEAVKGVKEVAFDDSEDHYTGTNALYDITFSGEEEEQISKDAMNAVRETLADYDTYVSTEVGAEEETSKALAKDMNLILVLAVIIIVAVLLLSTKAYMEIPVLLITFGVAVVGWITNLTLYVYVYAPFVQLAVLIATLVMAYTMSARIEKMSVGTARSIFVAFSALFGFTLSIYLYVYRLDSIILVFLATALYFGVLAAYGHFTKRNLAGIGPILFSGLIFLVVFGLVSLFIPALTAFDTIVCLIGIAVFLGYTAYDTQRIREYYHYYAGYPDMMEKASIFSALQLYLDFINLFLYLLRFLGKSRN